uniref:Si:dkey-246g23.2 n=1 Tax=Oryzias latipes TaxID=8090 RepID=A0A3P9M5B6_ORYLA
MDEEMILQEEAVQGSWTLLSLLASLLMVFGGALPYVPQYQEIQRSSNTEGFSTRVCLVLLIANIMRIFFWIGKQFEVTLLLQSVVMILTMFAMLHLCCAVQNSNRVSTKQHRITDLNVGSFWKWSVFEDYLLFCFGFTVLCAVVSLLLMDSGVFVETLGLLAVTFEAMLGMPQLLQNFNNRSTKGMRSYCYLFLWDQTRIMSNPEQTGFSLPHRLNHVVNSEELHLSLYSLLDLYLCIELQHFFSLYSSSS